MLKQKKTNKIKNKRLGSFEQRGVGKLAKPNF